MSTKASVKERAAVAHVLRRLSMGPQPDLAATLKDSDAAIARALDLSAPAATPPAIAPPPDYDTAQAVGALEQPITFWLQQMQSSPRLIEERLVWFWHDHFASSVAKVRVPYMMWQQHLLLREPRNRQLRRVAAHGVEGSRDALVPRRRHQHRARRGTRTSGAK